MASTRWEQEYERTTQECIDAAAVAALETQPRTTQLAGLNVFGHWPKDHPMLKGRNENTVTRWSVAP